MLKIKVKISNVYYKKANMTFLCIREGSSSFLEEYILLLSIVQSWP